MRGADLKTAAMGLKKFSGRLEGEISGAVTASAARAAETARQKVPVDSGALRGSIRMNSSGMKASVSASTPYAAIVEYGGSRTPPRPYLLPAAETARQELTSRAQALISRAVKELDA